MQKIKVLMIDDNVKLVDAVKEYFKDNDEIDIVLSAYDGLEGFEIITNKINEYDVIVLDLIMPKKDGIQVLKEMEQKGYMNFIPVIMVTGEATADTDKLAYDLGVSEIIYKPFASPMVYRRAMNIIQLFQYKRYL